MRAFTNPLPCSAGRALSLPPRQPPRQRHAPVFTCAASPTTSTTQHASKRPDIFDRAAFRSTLQASQLHECIQQAEALAGADGSSLSTEGRLRVYHALKGMHQQLFRQLVRAGDVPAIQRYLRLLPPKPRLFTSLLKECTVHSHRPALQAVLAARSAAGLTPDAFCFSALVTLASRQGDRDGIRNAFHAAVAEGCANTVLCNASMAGLIKCQAYQVILLWLVTKCESMWLISCVCRHTWRIRGVIHPYIPPHRTQTWSGSTWSSAASRATFTATMRA